MKQIFRLIAAATATFCLSAGAQAAEPQVGTQSAPQLTKDNIAEVVNAMTLEEKARLLVGGGYDGFVTSGAEEQSVGSGAVMGRQMKYVPGAAGTTAGFPRLGIPYTLVADGPAGLHIDAHRAGESRTYHATGFPVGTCIACTWNTQLAEEVGRAIGNETLEYGCDVVLGPGMNIHRNPLCGRNFEYYSEDPLVTGEIGAAMVNGIQSQGVGVSAKHFAVNSQETDRERVDEQVSERALREIYLRGFERMVKKSNPWTVMAAYNRINGVYAQADRKLLTEILRDEWGFNGIVMTDWIGVRKDLPIEEAIHAGDDLMMPGVPAQVTNIINAVNEGRLDIKDVDTSVRRLLEYIVKTPNFNGHRPSNNPDLKAHAAITRQSATEGMVLLKNNGVLPLPSGAAADTVALFGVCSYDFLSGGVGSGCVEVPYVIDMVTGLKNSGIATTPVLTEIYQKYVDYAKVKLQADKNPLMWFLDQGQPKVDEIEISTRSIESEAGAADAAVITIGRQAGEGMDRSIEGEFNLTALEQSLINRVSDIFHAAGKPVIVIINSGSVIETVSWRDRADAILVAWQPGEEGGNSVADVLTGKANPSGKLTMTWPVSVYDHWSTQNFPQDIDMYSYKRLESRNRPIKNMTYTKHEEGIYVGYRWFDTYHKATAYPFGFGLSYTSFEYSKPTVKQKGDSIMMSVTVTNSGQMAGKEAVQVYVSAPEGGMDKPAKELRAFAKTRLLQPSEKETLTMSIGKDELASYDEQAGAWVTAPGKYRFSFAANVDDTRCTGELNLK